MIRVIAVLFFFLIGLQAEGRKAVPYWTEHSGSTVSAHLIGCPTVPNWYVGILKKIIAVKTGVMVELYQNPTETMLKFQEDEKMHNKIFSILGKEVHANFQLVPKPGEPAPAVKPKRKAAKPGGHATATNTARGSPPRAFFFF